LYKEFAKYNKDAQGKDLKYIEELMAEDYRKWEEDVLDHPISSRLKHYFQSVFEFLHIVENKPLYYKIYRNIHSGMYKSPHLDNDSVKQFKKRYSNQVSSVDIPGVSRNATKCFANAKDFHVVGDAIVDYIIQIYDIDTIDKLKVLTDKEGKGFEKFK
jgi:hypothetical protein